MSSSPRTPAEGFSTILLWLALTVDGRRVGDRLPVPLIRLIMDRIRAISHRFARLAARIGAGIYAPRRPAAAPRRPSGPHPRQPSKLPQGFGWLVRLVQETAVYGSQLQFLFADPAMAALLAAAPAAMRRPVRSLCRMLGVAPPPILALPILARPPPSASPAPAPPPAPAIERRPPAPGDPLPAAAPPSRAASPQARAGPPVPA